MINLISRKCFSRKNIFTLKVGGKNTVFFITKITPKIMNVISDVRWLTKNKTPGWVYLSLIHI